MYTPINPSFTIEKRGLRGSTLYRHVSVICAHIEYSDQPVHTRGLIRDFADFAVRLKRTEILDRLKCIQRRLWPDCAFSHVEAA